MSYQALFYDMRQYFARELSIDNEGPHLITPMQLGVMVRTFYRLLKKNTMCPFIKNLLGSMGRMAYPPKRPKHEKSKAQLNCLPFYRSPISGKTLLSLPLYWQHVFPVDPTPNFKYSGGVHRTIFTHHFFPTERLCYLHISLFIIEVINFISFLVVLLCNLPTH